MKKNLTVMTSFGPVPFDVIKEHLPKEIVEVLETLNVYAQNTQSQDPIKDLKYYINKIAEKKSWSLERAWGWLCGIKRISPIAAFNIIAREIAVDLDNKYDDHIEKSERIYAISPLDGRVHQICKGHIKNYRNFAAFRNIEDAKYACAILRDLLKEMFKVNEKGKQKDKECSSMSK